MLYGKIHAYAENRPFPARGFFIDFSFAVPQLSPDKPSFAMLSIDAHKRPTYRH
jgi:hypothetical protein